MLKKRQTCNAKDYASERLPTIYFGLSKEIKHVVGWDGSENRGVPPNYVVNTNATDAEKPSYDDGCKQKTNFPGAEVLKCKETHQDDTGNKHNVPCQISSQWNIILKFNNKQLKIDRAFRMELCLLSSRSALTFMPWTADRTAKNKSKTLKLWYESSLKKST